MSRECRKSFNIIKIGRKKIAQNFANTYFEMIRLLIRQIRAKKGKYSCRREESNLRPSSASINAKVAMQLLAGREYFLHGQARDPLAGE